MCRWPCRSPSSSSCSPSSRWSARWSRARWRCVVALVTQGVFTALMVLAVVLAVQQIEGHVLQPFILGRAVRVHPLAVVLSVAAGGLIAGIGGAVVAVPLVAVTNTVVGYLRSYSREQALRMSPWPRAVPPAIGGGTDRRLRRRRAGPRSPRGAAPHGAAPDATEAPQTSMSAGLCLRVAARAVDYSASAASASRVAPTAWMTDGDLERPPGSSRGPRRPCGAPARASRGTAAAVDRGDGERPQLEVDLLHARVADDVHPQTGAQVPYSGSDSRCRVR